MPNLRIVDGKLWLQNFSDNLWYSVDVDILDGQPYIRSGQSVLTDPPIGTYSSYAVLKGPDGNYYRFYIDTFEGAQTYRIDETDPTVPNRLFVKGTDGLFYEISLGTLDGQIYAGLQLAGQNARFIDSPYKLISEVATKVERVIAVAQ